MGVHMEYKTCTNCHCSFPATSDYFHKQTLGKYGVTSRCIECSRKINNKHYQEVIKQDELRMVANRERGRKYYSENKDVCLANNKEWLENNKDHRKEYHSKYHFANKKHRNEDSLEWHNNHKEHCSKNYIKWRNDNLDHRKKYEKEWCLAHAEQIRLKVQKRIAIKRSLPSTLTIDEWLSTKEAFNNRCCYCNRELPLTQDHFVPLTDDGAYSVNNIVPCCLSCNSSKSNKSFFDFYPKYKYYSKERETKILDYLELNI